MMLTIQTKDFCNDNFDRWELYFEYHSVYILENGKEAYIGETNDIIRRTKEHTLKSLTNRLKKYKFNHIHIISGPLMEETPAKHYENLLIKIFRLEGKYKVLNGNNGEKTTYLRKNIFELYFDDLWSEMKKAGLVNEESYKDIINTAEYKFSPDTILTEAQFETRQSVIRVLKSGELDPRHEEDKRRAILINGDAGTGKTVVAISLLNYLKNDKDFKDKKIALVYSNSSTRKEVKNAVKRYKGLYAKDIISPCRVAREHYDIIICDEAQRLRRDVNLGYSYRATFLKMNKLDDMQKYNAKDELDWILINSDYQVFFYDSKQSTSPSDIPIESFEERLLEGKIERRPPYINDSLYIKNDKKDTFYMNDIFKVTENLNIDLLRKDIIDSIRGFRPIVLKEQMRIRAGNEYVNYIFNMLNQNIDRMIKFENYEFALFSSYADFNKMLNQRESEVGLCRKCSGYAWKWYGDGDIEIDGIKTDWNSQTSGWLRNEEKKYEMGSIYTLPGVDLNYAGVVIGPDLYYDKNDCEIKVNKKAYVDNAVKKGTTDDELKRFIINTYAVFLTRGILGTYVYVCDEALREYLSQFIPWFSVENIENDMPVFAN